MQRLVPELVERAAEIVGGIEELARRVHVDPHRVHYWRRGTATAPNSVVVFLVDLILKDDIERAHADRHKDTRPAERQAQERRAGAGGRA